MAGMRFKKGALCASSPDCESGYEQEKCRGDRKGAPLRLMRRRRELEVPPIEIGAMGPAPTDLVDGEGFYPRFRRWFASS